jgi:hypothetical protein
VKQIHPRQSLGIREVLKDTVWVELPAPARKTAFRPILSK